MTPNWRVESQQNVLDLDARGFRRAARRDVADHDTPVTFQPKRPRQFRRNRLRLNTDLTAADPAMLSYLLVHAPNDIARSRETDPGVRARARK